MPLTVRAIGVLEEILINPRHGGAKGLSTRYGEGRDALQTAISELKREGYLEVVTNKMSNGKIASTLKITDTGCQFLKTRIHILQSQLNPNNNLLLDINTDLLNINRIATQKEKEEKEEEKMDYEDAPSYISPEDMEEYRQKKQKRKVKEKAEYHEKQDAKRMKKRDDSKREEWTATDSGFEFAERMHSLWHVAPWKVTQSRFIYALDTKRSEYNTNGVVECQMMDIYFGKLKHNTKINDPELIWKMFIKEFGSLVVQAQRQNITADQFETERELSKKSRSILYVQD